MADANGDLFGITAYGAAFEIINMPGTPTGYASAPTILATLPPEDGPPTSVNASLTVDANGDLLGTTSGGAHAAGTVFEIVNTPTGYEKTPKIVFSFNNVDGGPEMTLIPDTKGDLFGETSEPGTVFEITGSGFVPKGSVSPGVGSDLMFQNPDGQAAIWGLTGSNVTEGGTVSRTPDRVGRRWATGDFNADGHADILWQNANGQAAIWDMVGSDVIGGGSVFPNLGVELESDLRQATSMTTPSFRHPVAELQWASDLGNERNQYDWAAEPSSLIPGRLGKPPGQATSMTTAISTSCFRIPMGRPRSGR